MKKKAKRRNNADQDGIPLRWITMNSPYNWFRSSSKVGAYDEIIIKEKGNQATSAMLESWEGYFNQGKKLPWTAR
jgi:hypothetical protein